MITKINVPKTSIVIEIEKKANHTLNVVAIWPASYELSSRGLCKNLTAHLRQSLSKKTMSWDQTNNQ